MKKKGLLVLALLVVLLTGMAEGGKMDDIIGSGSGGDFAQPKVIMEDRPFILAQEAKIALADKNLEPQEREVLNTMDAHRIMEVVNRFYTVYIFFYQFGSRDTWNKDYKKHNDAQYKDAIIKVKEACGKEKVFIFGTADEVGPSEANMQLSRSRAENVQARLKKDGAAQCQFHTTAVGQLQRDIKPPKEEPLTEAKKKKIAQYRKVDLWVPHINYMFKSPVPAK